MLLKKMKVSNDKKIENQKTKSIFKAHFHLALPKSQPFVTVLVWELLVVWAPSARFTLMTSSSSTARSSCGCLPPRPRRRWAGGRRGYELGCSPSENASRVLVAERQRRSASFALESDRGFPAAHGHGRNAPLRSGKRDGRMKSLDVHGDMRRGE